MSDFIRPNDLIVNARVNLTQICRVIRSLIDCQWREIGEHGVKHFHSELDAAFAAEKPARARKKAAPSRRRTQRSPQSPPHSEV